MVEHMFPAAGLILFGLILLVLVQHPIILALGFIMFGYGAYYIVHHSIAAKHHKQKRR